MRRHVWRHESLPPHDTEMTLMTHLEPPPDPEPGGAELAHSTDQEASLPALHALVRHLAVDAPGFFHRPQACAVYGVAPCGDSRTAPWR
jgi:hypothetical protein